jgi:hypothetical protein
VISGELDMTAFAVIVPLLIWALFMPLPAAACYLGLVSLFEGWLLMDLTLRRPALKDPTHAATPEQMMIRRYHQFLRYPAGAVANSRVCSAIALATIPWAALLFWRGHWIIACVVCANYFPVCALASILNPLSVLESSATRDPRAAVQLSVLASLLEKRHPS